MSEGIGQAGNNFFSSLKNCSNLLEAFQVALKELWAWLYPVLEGLLGT